MTTQLKLLYFPEDKQFMEYFYTCSICTEQNENLFTTIHRCGGSFCMECYQQWLITNIKGKITKIKCPKSNCKQILDDMTEITPFISIEMNANHQKNLTEEVLLAHPDYTRCANPKCDASFFASSDSSYVACVACRTHVCVGCKDIYHAGKTCEEHRIWKSTNNEDYKQSEDYKQKYAKKCPNCKTHIEKIEGCDHITCIHCKYQFCWKCLEKYYDGHIREKHWKRSTPVISQLPTSMSSKTSIGNINTLPLPQISTHLANINLVRSTGSLNNLNKRMPTLNSMHVTSSKNLMNLSNKSIISDPNITLINDAHNISTTMQPKRKLKNIRSLSGINSRRRSRKEYTQSLKK